MSKVAIGDKVVCLVTEHDVIAGREYTMASVSDNGAIRVVDDIQDNYTLLVNEYVVPATKAQASPILDIRGNTVYVRDTIAYTFAGSAYRHLALFEVMEINGPIALCRSLKDGAVTTLGVFEERAIIIK